MASETAPRKPFDVQYSPNIIGRLPIDPKWSAPFDLEFRPIETPNMPPASHAAFTSIGWHVYQNPNKYTPAYRVVEKVNSKSLIGKAGIEAFTASLQDKISVTDRRTGIITVLESALSDFEAVVCWYTREPSNEASVLCLDRKDNTWYVDAMLPELFLRLGADGTEVAVGEAHTTAVYDITAHTHAITMHGA